MSSSFSSDKLDQASELPHDTVTFLFTDIEGSTRLLEQLQAQYTQILEEQRQILRATQWYLASGKHPELQPRFDVIAVIVGSGEPAITHIPNAFGL